MTFAQIPAGAAVFLDANSLVYHFTNDPKYGVASTQLVQQIEQGALSGFTSTDVLTDVAHRLMTLEAIAMNGWPLRQHRGTSAQASPCHPDVDRFSAGDLVLAPNEHSGDSHNATAPGSCDTGKPAVRTPHRRRSGCRGHASPRSHPPRQ